MFLVRLFIPSTRAPEYYHIHQEVSKSTVRQLRTRLLFWASDLELCTTIEHYRTNPLLDRTLCLSSLVGKWYSL